ncbi:MAG: DUF4143 domain-containing protein [Bifidobacteriaceae bacterium]|nr:DUF4143 domain-containing protein [Bifidobacteriaceae bacterium]
MKFDLDGYIERAVAPRLKPEDGPNATAVKILEGARAVGKTTLVKHLRSRGWYTEYIDFGDPGVLATFEADPNGFLDQLAPRVIIDEAQLAPDLPLYVKSRVDTVGNQRRYLLTGSASIGRHGLGGSDPLTGRVERHRLDPLTLPELGFHPEDAGRMVDRLFGPAPAERRQLDTPGSSVRELVAQGGLPRVAAMLNELPLEARLHRVNDWVSGVLTDQIAPGEGMDAVRGRRVLDAVLRECANPLNTAGIGRLVDLDPRTVGRYLDIFEHRFLLRFLPNLATNSSRQGRNRSKIHPLDSVLAVESLLRANGGVLEDPQALGRLFECFVVEQLLAAVPLAKTGTEPYFWRARRGEAEVDLVLVAHDGRRVGIEVKSGGSVHPKDADGLRRLAASPNFHAGYVVYNGGTLTRLGDRIWALPFRMLVDGWPSANQSEGRSRQTKDTAIEPDDTATGSGVVDETPKTPVTGLFLSYAPSDNEYLGGAITALAEDLAKSYRFISGGDIKIFTPEQILVGEDAQERLSRELVQAAVLLAIVTPSYLNSEACRVEVQSFAAALGAPGPVRRLVPVILENPREPKDRLETDPVWKTIMSYQAENATGLRSLKRGSPEYLAAVERIATRLHDAIATADDPNTASGDGTVMEDEGILDGPGLSALTDKLTQDVRALASAANAAVTQLGIVLEVPSGQSLTAARLADAGKAMEPFIGPLETASKQVATDWADASEPYRQAAEVLSISGFDTIGIRRALETGIESLTMPQEKQIASMLDAAGRLSKFLRPSTTALRDALRTIASMRTGFQGWLDVLTQRVEQ